MTSSRQQAPGALELVRAFVNTLDVEDGVDELPSWLAARGTPADPAELDRARAAREAIRALVLANNGVEVDAAAAAAELERAAARARLELRFETDGAARLRPAARGVDALLGELLAAIASAQADGTWRRLKACRAEDCLWAFYDAARNRSRTWCSMAVCGNRQKARSYRSRHAAR